MNMHSRFEDQMAAMRSARDADPRQMKELPNNLDAEQGLLGAMLVNNEAYHVAAPTGIEGFHFYEPPHRVFFDAIKACMASGTTANPVTVRSFMSPEFLSQPVGDLTMAQYGARLAANATSIVNANDFACAVMFYYQRRNGLGAAEHIETACWNADDEITFLDQITAARDRLNGIINSVEGKGGKSDDEIIDDYLKMITGENDAAGTEGIPLPLPDFEYLINDNMLRPGRTYGILAASAEGKTSITLQVAYAAASSGHPVCYLSYDQEQMEILAQVTAQQEGVPFTAQIQNSRNHQRLSQTQIDTGYRFVNRLKRMPFEVIDCNTADTVPKLETKMDAFMRRRSNGKMPLFIFDHIRAIRSSVQGDEGSKALQIGQDIKSAVKKRHGAAWVLQQRSTSGLKRENPRPGSADLYGGDAAKQPFDVIFYAFRASEHRDEQIRTARDEADADKIRNRFSRIYGLDRNNEPRPVDGFVELGIIKNRFGPKNRRSILAFDAEYTRFSTQRRQDPELF
jgi:replicative DNA helicase